MEKKKFGWIELILGILSLSVGIYALIHPDTAFSAVVYIYGIVTLLIGIMDIVVYVKLERRTGFGPVLALISGIFSALAGLLLLIYPSTGSWVLSVLFPLWFIGHCISRISWSSLMPPVFRDSRYYFRLIIQILGIVAGLLLLINPSLSAITISYIIGLELILLGIEYIVSAF